MAGEASASITIYFDDGTMASEDDIPIELALEIYEWLVYEGVEFEFEVVS